MLRDYGIIRLSILFYEYIYHFYLLEPKGFELIDNDLNPTFI